MEEKGSRTRDIPSRGIGIGLKPTTGGPTPSGPRGGRRSGDNYPAAPGGDD
jgi:hypothetical protein